MGFNLNVPVLICNFPILTRWYVQNELTQKNENKNSKPLWCWYPRCFASRRCWNIYKYLLECKRKQQAPLCTYGWHGLSCEGKRGGGHAAENKSTAQFPLLNRTLWGQSLVGANRQLTKLDSESCFVILSNASQRWEACLGTSHSQDLPPHPPAFLISP